jgi:hypothetical protein
VKSEKTKSANPQINELANQLTCQPAGWLANPQSEISNPKFYPKPA